MSYLAESTYPMGVCSKHGPLLSVNGKAQCIPCVADANRPKEILINDVEDPGAEKLAELARKSTAKVQAPSSVYDMQAGLQDILNTLSRIPMPTSMKQYKLLMKVKQLIESALQEG